MAVSALVKWLVSKETSTDLQVFFKLAQNIAYVLLSLTITNSILAKINLELPNLVLSGF